ncbi:MAG TPA: hypothetical protein VFU21_14410 [Kofleriaceae bacterium]|nr:hypothetical protein [Kofleriaceae bacterium]
MSKTKKRGWFRSGEEDSESEQPAVAVAPAMTGSFAVATPPPAPAPAPAELAATRVDQGALDIAALLEAAGVAVEDRERVDRARKLLQALPSGVSAAVRRQIVETALTTFGVATDKIVEAGQKVSRALAAFVASNQQANDRVLAEARARVQALEQEIARVRLAAEQAAAAHQKRIQEANAEASSVHQVVDFFDKGTPEVEFDEPTEDRSDWGVQLPVPPPRPHRESASASKPPPMPGAASDPAKPHN